MVQTNFQKICSTAAFIFCLKSFKEMYRSLLIHHPKYVWYYITLPLSIVLTHFSAAVKEKIVWPKPHRIQGSMIANGSLPLELDYGRCNLSHIALS